MGLPSGVHWAPCNIDVSRPDGFAKSPFQYECSFFSWGNVDGHNPNGPASFSPWSWGAINSQEPWYDGQVYGDTPGNTLTSDIPVNDEFDAARANLGNTWRMPTAEEFDELLNNCIYINADGTEIDNTLADKRVTVNGIVGIYLQSKINGAKLFFSCSGGGGGVSWIGRGSYGFCWSSSFGNSRNASGLYFYLGGVNGSYLSNRNAGYAIRPVMKP